MITKAELASIREKMRVGIVLGREETLRLLGFYEGLEQRFAKERKIVQEALRLVSPEILFEVIEGSEVALEKLARTLPGHLLSVVQESPDEDWSCLNVVDGDLLEVLDEDGMIGERTGMIYAVLRDALEDKATRPGEPLLQLADVQLSKRYIEYFDPDQPEQMFVFAIETDGRISVVVPAKSDVVLQVRLVDELPETTSPSQADLGASTR